MKLTVVLLFIVALISCSESKKNQGIQIDQQSEGWKEFDTKDSIPKLLISALRKMTLDSFEIVNPNEPFSFKIDTTRDKDFWPLEGFIVPGSQIYIMPDRQMRLLARKKNEWRLTYLQDDIEKYYLYVEGKIKNDSIYDIKFAQTLLQLDNNDSINKYLAEQKLKPFTINLNQK